MTLTDGAVAALAARVAELIPAAVTVRVSPRAADDPYRWAQESWLVSFDLPGGQGASVHVEAGDSPGDALQRLVDCLDEFSETRALWGRALPACPGHAHEARIERDNEAVVLRCPSTGDVVERIEPLA